MAESKSMGELSHTEPSGIAAASMYVKQHNGILIFMFKKKKKILTAKQPENQTNQHILMQTGI